MYKRPNYRILFFFCFLPVIFFLLIADILPQSKDKTTNWPEPVFEHLTIADGLPENSVRCILQDHLGYMWFGTQNGLVRYDGYNMKVYKPERDDSQSISSGQIIKIYEDHTGTLWVGTLIGLNKFDRSNETFKRYIYNADGSTNVTSKSVRTIYEDKEGRLFIGTNNSLELFDCLTGSFKRIYYSQIIVRALIEDTQTGNLYVGIKNKIMIYDPEKETLKMKAEFKMDSELGNINSFFQAADGIIWIGHSKGLAKFNSLLNTIKYYQPKPSLQYTKENDIGPLVEDERGFIWGGGFWSNECNQGLVCFNPENEQFKMYKSDTNKQYSLSGNYVNSICKDQSGIIWVGTWLAGLNKWDPKKQKIKRYTYDPVNPKRDNFNSVYSISENPSGVIWFTADEELYSFNRFADKFNHYKFDPENNGTYALYIENSNTIWFGANNRGLGKFNRSDGKFKFYSNDPYDSTTISNNAITYILPDRKDILWLGTFGGLNKFDKSSVIFIRYVHDPKNKKSISSNKVFQIFKDRKGTFWIETNTGGLNKFNSVDGTFKSFFLTKESSIPTVLLIYEDIKEKLCIGTYDSGLHLFDRKREISVYNITEKDGLANNLVESILEDDSGNLWIGTANGLSKFNIQSHHIKNYFITVNFDGNRYRANSAFKTSTGEMLFGTYDGFIMFNPDSIKDDPVPPQVVISNVSLFNEPDKKLKFDGFIPDLDELDLSYNENDLRFDYVGLHYGDPSKNLYKYKLEGFDKDWIDTRTQRNAVYTNLDAGEYTFRVKTCNLDGVWNEQGASLKIIIPPPFWATWWAYTIYILFGLFVLYSLRRYELNRTQLKNQVKLDEVKLMEREETDRMKSRFFANISHEFRTPLTLILGSK